MEGTTEKWLTQNNKTKRRQNKIKTIATKRKWYDKDQNGHTSRITKEGNKDLSDAESVYETLLIANKILNAWKKEEEDFNVVDKMIKIWKYKKIGHMVLEQQDSIRRIT